MDVFLNRYRNLTALVVAILAQLALLAYQVRDDHDIRLIRVWAVGAVTPAARVLEYGRSGTSNFFKDYLFLLDTRQENKLLKGERDRLLLDNQQLRAELGTAERARDLAIFQQTSPQTTLAARVIGNTTGGSISNAASRAIMVDRGSSDGILKGMAVITPAGIVGKVIQVFPGASYVMLITDPAFVGGAISQENQVRGRVKGQGSGTLLVDGVQSEQPVDKDEWFFTSGDDLIFPRGLPVGRVATVRPGSGRKDVFLVPSGLERGLDEVLIVTRSIHGTIPEAPVAAPAVDPLPPPASSGQAPPAPPASAGSNAGNPPAAGQGSSPNPKPARPSGAGTDADRIMETIREGVRAKGNPGAVPPESGSPPAGPGLIP